MSKSKKNPFGFEFEGIGLDANEKIWGEKRFKDYIKAYNVESLSDLQLLSELVMREAYQQRYQKKVGEVANSDSADKGHLVPGYLLKTMDDNLDKIINLKETLGLFSEKGGKDPFEYIQTLKKKFKLHRLANRAEYSIPCPYCEKMLHLKLRTKFYKATKHSFFPKGRFLTNDHLWKLYKEGTITKEDIAMVLGVATDYIDSLKKKFYSDK